MSVLRRISQRSSESRGLATAGSIGSTLIFWVICGQGVPAAVGELVGQQLEGHHAEAEDVDPLVGRSRRISSGAMYWSIPVRLPGR